MLMGNNTRSLQQETSEITSLLNQFPANTNVLVVDNNFTTLLNMKQMMRQYAYQGITLSISISNFIVLDFGARVVRVRVYNFFCSFCVLVTIETDAEKALAFLTNCKHEINIVLWDFHMPGIDGLQALEIIGSKMDLPVVSK